MRLKLLTVLATALATVGTAAPAATASHALVRCRLVAVSHAPSTGTDWYEGMATGVVVGNLGEGVSIRCVVRVNSTIRATTAWGVGTTVAATSDRVSYRQTDTQFTTVCAQYWTGEGSFERCYVTNSTQVPPSEAYDAVAAGSEYVEPIVCPTLASVWGGYGLAEIKPDGDTYVTGRFVLDCAPYEYPGPPHLVEPAYITQSPLS